ncbi:MAG: HAD hydrolase family protein, partial [Firmicutes bacterium]|nr:HAD hydrolase family protein [Bacillota bacterium]
MILGADWDNTIKINHDVRKEDIEAINNFRKHNKFGVVTGRTLSMIKPELEKYHLGYDFLVCSNGTVVFDEDDNLISRIDMDHDEASELLSYLISKEMVFC